MTGRTKVPEPRPALGVRARSGWAAYVVLIGPHDAPTIARRGRMELCDGAINGSKQPFHQAERMALADAEKFIGRCRASSAALAEVSLAAIEKQVGSLGVCAVLTASGGKLPALNAVLASHALIHAAEGELYRDAVAEACRRRAIPVLRIRERDIANEADGQLPLTTQARARRVETFGKQVGSPWRQDEKLSALAAWLALVAKPPGSPSA